jgi:hypothetical protein
MRGRPGSASSSVAAGAGEECDLLGVVGNAVDGFAAGFGDGGGVVVRFFAPPAVWEFWELWES